MKPTLIYSVPGSGTVTTLNALSPHQSCHGFALVNQERPGALAMMHTWKGSIEIFYNHNVVVPIRSPLETLISQVFRDDDELGVERCIKDWRHLMEHGPRLQNVLWLPWGTEDDQVLLDRLARFVDVERLTMPHTRNENPRSFDERIGDALHLGIDLESVAFADDFYVSLLSQAEPG